MQKKKRRIISIQSKADGLFAPVIAGEGFNERAGRPEIVKWHATTFRAAVPTAAARGARPSRVRIGGRAAAPGGNADQALHRVGIGLVGVPVRLTARPVGRCEAHSAEAKGGGPVAYRAPDGNRAGCGKLSPVG